MSEKQAKPFLKWAGGKTQLLAEISSKMPFGKDSEFVYIEPFVGSGAVLFWILSNYPSVKKVVINDINSDLTNTYESIKSDVESVISLLELWESEYHQLAEDDVLKKQYYYDKRNTFNARSANASTQAALMIFLNKTCFNGLYRVNKSNGFNVPIGSYKKPTICDKENLRAVSQVLSKVIVLNGDFEATLNFVDDNTFVYLDPPYKPLNQTSSFNSYAKDEFNDEEQIRLKEFCDKLNLANCHWVLSNSDVKNTQQDNEFFDDLYNEYKIDRVWAKRSINSKSEKRGKLTELLISNVASSTADI